MSPQAPSIRQRLAKHRRNGEGFSLIECALALGVMSFAFVALVGMIPVGLNTFHGAIDATVSSQIAQGLLTEVRQSKFSELAKFDKNVDADPAKPNADYYFGDQGTTTPTTTAQNHVYEAAVQVSYIGKLEVGVPPADLKCDPAIAHAAVIHIVVRRISAPDRARDFIGLVANNGL
jgi:uncharacterized protein (TIGR02598 family)